MRIFGMLNEQVARMKNVMKRKHDSWLTILEIAQVSKRIFVTIFAIHAAKGGYS